MTVKVQTLEEGSADYSILFVSHIWSEWNEKPRHMSQSVTQEVERALPVGLDQMKAPLTKQHGGVC